LRKIHDIPRILLRIKKVEATHVEWCRLYSSLEAALPILDLITTFVDDIDREECDRSFIRRMLDQSNQQIPQEVFERLQSAIDFESSMETGSTIIKDGYDATLDQIRNVYDRLESFLTQAAHQILEIVPLLQNISVEYVPQIGYLVAVPHTDALLLQPYVKPSSTRRKRPRDDTRIEEQPYLAAEHDWEREGQQFQANEHDWERDGRERGESWRDERSGFTDRRSIERERGAFISLPIFVCIHICIYKYIFVYMCIFTYICERTHLYACVYIDLEERSGFTDRRSINRGILDFNDAVQGLDNGDVHMDLDREDIGDRGDEDLEDEEEEGFQFVYAQGDLCYYKHKMVTELDDTIGDVQSSITDRQRALLLEVEDAILDAEGPLQQLASLLSKVDAIISLGAIAAEMDFVRPEIVEESVIIIKEGRHLLQELTVEGNFVPNDTYISVEKNINLITGPNSSGKSVYLKQVGLLVYLAHIGSWLPCTKAVIGLTDRIMTRITSFESVAAAQSSFSLDLGQMAKMLRTHTKRTLCLVDEFGKGTTPIDGIALLATTIKHFVENKAKAIFVLHFTEILHPDILNPSAMCSINTFRMQTHESIKALNRDENEDDFEDYNQDCNNSYGYGYGNSTGGRSKEETLPLYLLQLGVAPSSNGISCARNAGVSTSALDRALEVKECITSKRPIKALATFDRNMMLGDQKHRDLLSLFLSVKDWGQGRNGNDGEDVLFSFKYVLI
jgi:DNA mismatch repair protein MSH5